MKSLSSDAFPIRVAVVGGGMAGLTAARILVRHRCRVRVFDKARRAGGRLSTRRVESQGQVLSFDHGAQYFTAYGRAFVRCVEQLREQAAVGAWTGILHSVSAGDSKPVGPDQPTRWVGVPTMSAVPRALAQGLDVTTATRIVGLQRGADSAWTLRDDGGDSHGPFDIVIVTTPAEQASALLEPQSSAWRQTQAGVMHPCWALMVVVDGTKRPAYDAAFLQQSPLRWAMRQSSKPGRPNAEAWVLHATPAWTDEYWDAPAQVVRDALLSAWAERGGPSASHVHVVSTQRWRYALASDESGGAFFDPVQGLGLAGDWLGGARVEGAFVSGRSVAARVLWHLRSRATPG